MEKSIRKYERFKYSDDDLQNALEEIKKKILSLSAASRKYGIPKSTLFNKIKGKVPLIRKMGPDTILTVAEEAQLEKWIIEKALLGFPMHHNEVKDSVQRVLKTINRPNPFVDDRPGRKWLKLFLNRHPKVSQRSAEIISKARAAVSEAGIRSWFQELNQYLQNENCADILNDSSRIFNADETGLQTCPKTGKLLGPKNYRNFYEIASGPEKECITVLCTFSAAGDSAPPMVVYPYKRIPSDIAATFPEEWGIGRSDSGWMTSATFYEYVANIFFPWVLEHHIKLPILLMLDGHKSHIGMDLYNLCTQKGIMLYCLLPNATHILQPCDVSVFKSIKVHWKQIVRQHKQKTSKSITKSTFVSLFKIAYDQGVQPSIIKNGFRKCGIFPFDADAVDYSRCVSKRREEQKMISDSQIIDASEYQIALKVMEHHMDSDLLLKFKSSSREITESSLFNMWKTVQEGIMKEIPVENMHVENEINTNSIQDNTIINIEMVDLPNDFILPQELMRLPVEIDGVIYESSKFNYDFTDSNANQQKMEQVEMEVFNREESKIVCIQILEIIINAVYEEFEKSELKSCKKIIVHSNITIQNAWLKHLHWPKIENKGVKRKSVTPMPFAITSKKWKEYVEDIETRKKEKEESRIQKRRIRDKKITEKIKKEGKKKDLQTSKPKTAKSETTMVDFRTSETPKKPIPSISKCKIKPDPAMSAEKSEITKKSGELSITIGSYVIVKYGQQYFPGIVESIDGEEYEIRAMSPAGANYFKWPNPPDQIWYKKTAVKEAIEAPKLIKRCCYQCPEISKYNLKL